jgi:hypothetical protein
MNRRVVRYLRHLKLKQMNLRRFGAAWRPLETPFDLGVGIVQLGGSKMLRQQKLSVSEISLLAKM